MTASLRQLQEKCKEQMQPLNIAFIELTKAFDLVSRDGLFKVLKRIECPPKLLSVIKSSHKDIKGVVQFEISSSTPFEIKCGVKQGCVLLPSLFGIYFTVMLKHAFGGPKEGIYLYTRLDGKLYNLDRLRAKTKIRKVLIRDLLFADDVALVAHSKQDLQTLLNTFSKACGDFKLIIILKKTNITGINGQHPPNIHINNYQL
ncbi:uncharacterized protein LOC143030010 [Oratosquilla oratoria]|uniref:uncharacterized protein LOC143030010 n=1 Tax=Oratosquilla oratoria TaxID=337810 RepID=UPI003F75A7B5